MSKPNILLRACKWMFALLAVLLLLVGGLLLWLQSGPTHISELTSLIIDKLQAPDAPYELTVDAVELDWKRWRRPATLRLQGLHLRSAEYDSVLSIPSGYIELDWKALFSGELRIAALELEGVSLVALREGESWSLRGEDNQLLYRFVQSKNNDRLAIFPVDDVQLVDMQLTVKDTQEAAVVTLSPMRLSILKGESETIEVLYDISGQITNSDFALTGSGELDTRSGNGVFTLYPQQLNPAYFCQGWIDCTELPTLDMEINGSLRATLSQSRIQGVNASLKAEAGEISFNPHLPETLKIKAFSLEGDVDIEKKAASLKKIALAFADTPTSISATGEARLPEEGGGFYLDADAEAIMMPVNDLYKYWPQGLAPQTRDWATTRIREGMAPKASAKIKLKPEDLEPENLPDAFLASEVHVQESTVNYIDGFPIAQKVNGVVRFTGTTMTASINDATTMDATLISDSTIHFTDLNAPGTPVEIDLNLNSTPQDTYRFMEKLPFNPLQKHNINVQEAAGEIAAKVSLAFDAFSDAPAGANVNWDALNYKLSANTEKLDGLKIQDKLKMDAVNGSVEASNNRYDVNLKGRYQDQPYQFTYDAMVGKSQVLGLKGRVPEAMISAMLPEITTYLKGSPEVDLTLTRQGNAQWAPVAFINLTQAQVRLPFMKYDKPKGEASSLRINAPPEAPDRISWDYEAKELQTSGKVQFDWDKQEVIALEVSRYLSASQDFRLRYQPMEEGFRADLTGRRLDLTPLWQPKQERQATISDMPPIQLRLDLKELVFPTGGSMRELGGHLFCNATRCRSADVIGLLPKDGQFSLFIGPEEGKRRFRLRATQLGELAHLLDIHDKLSGGKADISGTYDDKRAGNPLDGRALIQDFVIQDGPIMATLLNNASLTGLLDNLRGDGIRFDKFASDFVFAEDLLTLKDAKAAGPSMGILIDGEVNIATNMLDLSGNLAPAYVINSFIGKIPLIGEVLVGGKGESVFAINFSVKGGLDDPSIIVNPLSALTPGFTRKFFDIFDTPPDTSAPETKQ